MTAPRSRRRIPPSRRTRGPGIPWTTSSLTEAQRLAGNPRYPRNDGSPPSARIRSSAIRSSSRVVTPGRTASTTARSAWAATSPARRITARSAGDLTMITTGSPLDPPPGPRPDELHDAPVDVLHAPLGVHGQEQPALPVVVHQGRRPLAEDLQPVEDRIRRVVFPLHQLGTVDVAPPRDAGALVVQVVDRAARGTHAPARQAADEDRLPDLEQHHRVEVLAALGQQPLQGLGLPQRPGIAIQDEAPGAVRLGEAASDDLVDDLVGDQVAPLHVFPRAPAHVGLVADGLAENVPGRDVGDLVALVEQLRLGPLARAGRTHKDEIHAAPVHFMNPSQ